MASKRARTVSALVVIGGLLAGSLAVLTPTATQAAEQAKPTISEDAIAAVTKMGQALNAATQLSFQARTIGVYLGPGNAPLHVFHTVKASLHRPNHLAIDMTGDDGSNKLFFDGKSLTVFSVDAKQYVSVPAAEGTTLAKMFEDAGERLGLDFPLADLLVDAPDKSILDGVTSGSIVDTSTIDGVACLHLFFTQPPGIELELWLPKDGPALPKRLIVTNRAQPGNPSTIAVFSDWNTNAQLSDAGFTFQPPADAQQISLQAPEAPKTGKGAKQ